MTNIDIVFKWIINDYKKHMDETRYPSHVIGELYNRSIIQSLPHEVDNAYKQLTLEDERELISDFMDYLDGDVDIVEYILDNIRTDKTTPGHELYKLNGLFDTKNLPKSVYVKYKKITDKTRLLKWLERA